MNDQTQEQMSLFSASVLGAERESARDPVRGGRSEPVSSDQPSVGRVQARTVMINPHLLAARRIAKKMRRLPDRSAAETRAGLAICARLKAYLADAEHTTASDQSPRH